MKKTLIKIIHEILNIISEIDEFKGQWKSIVILMPDKLNQLKKVATIESIGSSTRIEGVKLSHQEIANELNTSREVISRLLKKLEQRGTLKLHRNHIELLK